MRLKVKKAGSVDLLAKLQEAARNTDELMQRMGGYVRAVAVEKIDSGEGLAPWAESTRKKYESTGTSKITLTAAKALLAACNGTVEIDDIKLDEVCTVIRLRGV